MGDREGLICSTTADADPILGWNAQRLAMDHTLDLPRPINRIGTCDHLIGVAARKSGDVKVFAFDFVQMVAFADTLSDHRAARVWNDLSQVLIEFNDAWPAGSRDRVNLTVIIEENRQVMHTRQLISFPWAVG